MLKIVIPTNNIPERQYIVDFLLNDILGLNYSIDEDDLAEDYVIEYEEKKLIIKDSFFSSYSLPGSYISSEALPENIIYVKNEYLKEENIPVIYGTDELKISDEGIICGIDIFASSFFMLTRWEEYVNKSRDIHGRFPGKESVAYKTNFLQRPVVNEYCEFLWHLLEALGFNEPRRERSFKMNLTHDIDVISYRKRSKFIALSGDILKRANMTMAFQRMKYLFLNNPYDTFDFLMDQSENAGIRSRFYFMAAASSQNKYEGDNYIDKKDFITIQQKIKDRGHVIGLHSGYDTYLNRDKWRKEKIRLEQAISGPVSEGRQHFLRFDIEQTPGIWEENGLILDSSMGYSDCVGFRCGTGDIYPLFDFINRKKRRVKECPLIIMEGVFKCDLGMDLEEIEQHYRIYIESARKYKMLLTLLFHNSSFDSINWPGWLNIYQNIFKY